MSGFFSDMDVKSSGGKSLGCVSCGLYRKCITPRMPASGNNKVLIVGEAPGQKEDEQGTQFVGESGLLLDTALSKLGVDLRRDCSRANSVACRPVGNATPTDHQIDCCRDRLFEHINDIKPRVIILLGISAVRSVIGKYWPDIGPLTRWTGWRIPSYDLGAWLCPTWHPAYLLRDNRPVLSVLWSQHLEQAMDCRDLPENQVHPSSVEMLMDDQKVSDILHKMMAKGGTISLDFETNMLKPDSSKARIVSCAVCWNGRKTVAYPFYGKAVKATSDLLRSDLPKIGANMKFEERWSLAKLGHVVNNWVWDTVVGAHVLDNRAGVTSVKFQAFATMGVKPYNLSIAPYLEGSGSDGVNKIDKVPIEHLLKYNGMDALVEYHLAQHQMSQVK